MPKTDKFNPQFISMALATEADFFEVKHFLKRHKESSANRHDRIYIVRYEKRLIGITKLVSIANGSTTKKYWLRGLYIDGQYRNLGLASQLLSFMNQNLSTEHDFFEILAFPYSHLENFYLRNGYQHIETSKLPKELQERYLNAVAQQKNWICMAQNSALKN